jgi:Na+(H+)/acetate symporter ActP
MRIIDKLLLTLLTLSLFLPFIFPVTETYTRINDMGVKIYGYTLPDVRLFSIPVGLLAIWVISLIWGKELSRLGKWFSIPETK